MGRNFERKYFRDKIRYLNSVKSFHSVGLSTLKLASLAKMTPDPLRLSPYDDNKIKVLKHH